MHILGNIFRALDYLITISIKPLVFCLLIEANYVGWYLLHG